MTIERLIMNSMRSVMGAELFSAHNHSCLIMCRYVDYKNEQTTNRRSYRQADTPHSPLRTGFWDESHSTPLCADENSR